MLQYAQTSLLNAVLAHLDDISIEEGDWKEVEVCLSMTADLVESTWDPGLGGNVGLEFFPQSFMRLAAATGTRMLGVEHSVSLKLWLMR